MKLYDMTGAPNPRRVRIFLAEKGIEVDKVQIDIMGGENLRPEYLAINPRGILPTLQLDDGSIIDETSAISRYFEETVPAPPLFGETPEGKAQIESWVRYIEAEGLTAAADLVRNTNPAFENRSIPGTADTAQIPALAERGAPRVRAFYARLDNALASSTYVAGESFSAADIAAFCAIDFAEYAGVPVDASLGHLSDWRARVSARPSAQA